MKCVIFELDGVLRDMDGSAISGNVALAKSLYSAGHDVLIMRAKHAYEWLHANDVFYDDIIQQVPPFGELLDGFEAHHLFQHHLIAFQGGAEEDQ